MLIQLSILVTVILNQYFNDTKCILYLLENSESVVINNVPLYLFYTDENGGINISYKESERCQDFIIQSNKAHNVISNLELYLQRNTEVRYNRRKYLIFLPDSDVGLVFNTSNIRFIADLIVIKYVQVEDKRVDKFSLFENMESYFKIYTHRYIGKTDNNLPVLMDEWLPGNKSFRYGTNLYPDKFSDQQGRIVKVITADYNPYSHLESKTGSEMALVLLYGEKYNVTLQMELTDLWGKMYKNWTGTGIMGSVIMDEHDIGFSALFALPNRIIYSDFSKPTAFSRVSCVVPAPREAEGWFTHLKVFNIRMWSLIIGSYASLGITVHLTKTLWCAFSTNTHYFSPLSLVGIFVSHPIPSTQIPNVIKLRYVFALILILTVMVATMYNSRLSSILVVPVYVDQIKTVEDLALSSIRWGELQDDWVLPIQTDDRPLYKIINNKFLVESEETLRQLSIENHFAFGTERLLTGYYAVGPYMREDVIRKFVVMDEDIYQQYTNLQLRKSSVLLPSIDTFIGRVTETGLPFYWERQASVMHFDNDVQLGLRYPKKGQGLVRLKIVHVKGVFLLWMIGLSFAIMKFVHELVRARIKKKMKLSKAKEARSAKKKKYKEKFQLAVVNGHVVSHVVKQLVK